MYKKFYSSYKNFRNSADWPPHAASISHEVCEILKYASVIDTLADNSSIRQHMAAFSGGAKDFNDQIIVEGCQLDSGDLVSHDSDMQEGGLNVLTENRALLLACP